MDRNTLCVFIHFLPVLANISGMQLMLVTGVHQLLKFGELPAHLTYGQTAVKTMHQQPVHQYIRISSNGTGEVSVEGNAQCKMVKVVCLRLISSAKVLGTMHCFCQHRVEDQLTGVPIELAAIALLINLRHRLGNSIGRVEVEVGKV